MFWHTNWLPLTVFCLLVQDWREFLSFGNKTDGEGIDAMACVFLGQTLAQENMAEVTTTIGTLNFSSSAIGIGHAFDGIRIVFVKAGPAAS